MEKIKHISLFAGIGGLEYGLIGRSECVGISEIKQSSVNIYKKNYGDVKNFGDITKIDIEGLPDFDMLLGGFPCQSFSLAGLRQGFEDKRGKMIFYICDILKVKSPDFFVLENVKGILNHNDGKTFENVLKLLNYLGYNVRAVLLNSLYYGSAQNRERVFFLGSKKDFKFKRPVIIDDSKRFRDIRENDGEYKILPRSDFNFRKVEQKRKFNFELVGGYDRVGTLTTQFGCGEKVVAYEDWVRYLTTLECERLQGFPDGWTKGESDSARYYALGNAVNCSVSNYLFNDYLKGLWF